MKSSDVCTSIEGESLEITCRKFMPKPPKRDAKLGKLVYPFKLSIHGSATIKKEFENKGNPWREISHLNHNDEIHGEALDCFAGKPLKKPDLINATGTHKAMRLTTYGGSYAHVEIGIREHLNRKLEHNNDS